MNMLTTACLAGVLSASTVAFGAVSWDVKITNKAPGQLHRDEEMVFEVVCTSPSPVKEVTLKVASERLIRGDTIYEGPVGGPYRVSEHVERPPTVLDDRMHEPQPVHVGRTLELGRGRWLLRVAPEVDQPPVGMPHDGRHRSVAQGQIPRCPAYP